MYSQLLARRHPEFDSTLEHWDFLYSTYVGGRDWFEKNIWRYHKEGSTEYADRVKRAYRFNHSREVVDLVVKYLFKAKIARSEDSSKAVKDFWRLAGGGVQGQADIQQFMRDVATRSSIYGRIYVVVDATSPTIITESEDGYEVATPIITKADENRVQTRTYAYTIGPQRALDMSFDDFGELNWILFLEDYRDDDDPFGDVPYLVQQRYRLWTRDKWYLFTPRDIENQVYDTAEGEHGLGIVPVVIVDHITSDESWYSAPALIGDVAYLDRACANYLSNLDAIIQDQTFSQLVIPAQSLPVAIDGQMSEAQSSMIEMGTKRIFTYDASNGAPPPGYISPDVKQAQLLIATIEKIINEIYHSVGVAGERTKQDNSLGIDNSSGVAKAYDFDRVNALLAAKAASLERAENKIARLVDLWANNPTKEIGEQTYVSYLKDFDIRGLADEFDIAVKLSMIDAPDAVRRKQMEQVIRKLFPEDKESDKQTLISELKDWPTNPVNMQPQSSQISSMFGKQGQANKPDETGPSNKSEVTSAKAQAAAESAPKKSGQE